MSNCCQLNSFLYNFSSLVNLSDCVFQLVFSNNAMDDNSDDDNVVLPSNLRDYYPSWKKSEKTFLDVYIVSKKTEELLDACREFIIAERCANFDQKMESGVWRQYALSVRRSQLGSCPTCSTSQTWSSTRSLVPLRNLTTYTLISMVQRKSRGSLRIKLKRSPRSATLL